MYLWRPMERRRIDTLLAERGLAGSRTSAAESVRAGRVRIGRDGPRATKPGQLVSRDVELLVDGERRYVSRGGLKLEHALEELDIDVSGRQCLDVGASTGGFTDCLLRRGAERVIALDVGYGQLDWTLRNDPRVEVMERLNARHLRPDELPYCPDLATIDVSFISLKLILPAVMTFLCGELVALIKPQFEVGKADVGKGGIVRDDDKRRAAVDSVVTFAKEVGLRVMAVMESPVKGAEGNIEYLMHAAGGTGEAPPATTPASLP